MSKLVLLTIGVSHYCEKARWALDRSGMKYEERTYPPILHYLATVRYRTKRTLPALLTPHGKILDSTDILHFVDRMADPETRLFPDNGERTEVEELESYFDERLGPATRRWAYSWVTKDPELMYELVKVGISPAEAKLLRAMLPVIITGLTRGLGLGPAAIEKTQVRIAEVFEKASARIRGKRYFVGDRLTAADLTFAALGAPAVGAPEYGLSGAPDLARLPDEMRRTIEALRATPAGEHALRIYRDHRREKVTTR